MKTGIKSDTSNLRHKAEKLLNGKNTLASLSVQRLNQLAIYSANQSVDPTVSASGNLSEVEADKLIHELEVHQIELEMQNEELMSAINNAKYITNKYTKLYDFSPSGYFTLSANGEIIDLNLCGAEMLGKYRSSLKSSRFGFFVSEDTLSVFNHFLDKVFKSKTKKSCEVNLSAAGKYPTYVYLTGLADENGEQCLVSAIDITTYKLSYLALRESEENVRKLQKAIGHLKASVVITDRDGKIEYANPFFSQLTGYTREEYMGGNPGILKSGYHTEAFYDDLWQTIKSGQTWEGEFYNKKKNGEYYWENAIISPIFNEINEITHFVAIKTDITEAKKINEELIRTKLQAEESDKLKTAFLNNISHEIRTPFNGILGFLGILQSDDLTTGEREEYTRIINESAYRLMNTINDIIELSQIQTGQIRIKKSIFSIKEFVNELTERFLPGSEKKGLQFKVFNDVPLNEPNICTDRTKLTTIFNNLLSNAVKFTNAGFIELGIRIKDGRDNAYYRDKVCLVSTPTMLEFTIKDTGIGIPENKLQSIFERFVQVDGSNTRHFEGLGLGTTIAKAYVEMLGGTIKAESEVGKGSVFSFTVSCQTELMKTVPLMENVLDKAISGKNNRLKILIVEDDDSSAMLLKLAVKPFYREVLLARTGVEARDVCRKNPDIDLVLMDIKMPEMDGYEATRQIRKFNSELIIVAQTAYSLSSDQDKAIASGCNDFITKPIHKEKLSAIIHKYFKLNLESINSGN